MKRQMTVAQLIVVVSAAVTLLFYVLPVPRGRWLR